MKLSSLMVACCSLFVLPDALTAAEPLPVPADSVLKAEGNVAFTEGPAWHPSGNVYFSDIANSRIMRRDRTGQIHVYRTPSGKTNGLLFDHKGRLLCCEGGGADSNRRVTRIELDGTITVLADRYRGKKLNSPNDLAIDYRGRIYFTDPRYRNPSGMEQLDEKGVPIEGVYRIDDVRRVKRVLTHEVDRPNGILVSHGSKYLYVADNCNDGPRGMGGNRKLWRFSLKPDGDVVPNSRKLMFDWGGDRGPDGMAMDTEGRIYVAAGFNFPNPPRELAKKYKAGVYVISPAGKLLQFIPIPMDMVTNCTFGGDELEQSRRFGGLSGGADGEVISCVLGALRFGKPARRD